MDLLLFSTIVTTAILFAVWNGLVIDWRVNNHSFRSNEYHTVGFILRLLFLPLFWGHWLELSFYCMVCYPIYNMTVAHLMGQNIWYVGNTSKIDKVMGKFNPYIYTLLIVIFIILLIMKIWQIK